LNSKFIKNNTEVNSMQKINVKNGKVWEKATLHLKSAITGFDRHNIAKQVELELLKKACSLKRIFISS